MKTSEIPYQVRGETMLGFLAYEESLESRPAVVVAHAWRGQDDFARDKAIELAKLGYVGFAADVYGNGVHVDNDEASLQLMLPLFEDRKLLQERINGAVDIVRSQPQTDTSRIGAIGFCFGGLTVLELLRSGADIRCIVSFHALLADVLGEVKAKRTPNQKIQDTSILFLHGHDDPMVSETDIKKVLYEMDEGKVDWQFHTYGHAMHAFTNPQANDEDKGIVYEPLAAKRSWQSMKNFLDEQLQLD